MGALVSIVMPSYNSSFFIKEAIQSVLNQTYQYWELIIVDDCSQDQTYEIIENFAEIDSRIKIYALKRNVGAAEARNIALRAAKGRFIAFLDSDDTWLPEKLEIQIQFMLSRKIAFSFTSYHIINSNGNELNKVILVPEIIEYHTYLRNTIIGCLTVVIDKSKTGYFEMPNIKSSHDMALWLSIMKKGFKAYGINKVLASYRLVSSSNTANKFKAAKDVWKVYREIEKINLFFSIYYFMGYSWNALKKRL